MPNCYLFIAQCLTGKQSARSPQEEQTGYWVENFLFKGNQPFSLHPSYLSRRRGKTSETAAEETKSSHVGSSTCRGS